ncbi:MAG: hypothetical protein ACOYEF_15855 [Planifilum sp.]|jgi:integrase
MASIKLRKQLADNLKAQYQRGRGTSKHADKARYGAPKADKIYSRTTLQTYKRECSRFTSWCYDRDIRDLIGAREAAPDYLRELIDRGLSASSVHTAAFAMAKGLGCKVRDFDVDLPIRHRADYTRSRERVERDINFNERKHGNFVEFCRSTGLRRDELRQLEGRDIRQRGEDVFIHVRHGKGGREREVQVYSTPEVKREIVEHARSIGPHDRYFDSINTNADIHHYRADFAARVYHEHARPLENLSREEKYYCRGDRKGEVFDREAMRIASEQLGHSRIDVIAQSYLYTA